MSVHWLSRARLSAILVLLGVIVAWPTASHVHLDPGDGAVSWYPYDCCHDRDCRPVVHIEKKANIIWMTTTDGLTLAVDPKQSRRLSQDHRWHVCIDVDELNQTFVRCIFEPAPS